MTKRHYIRALVALAAFLLAGASTLAAQNQALYQVRVDSVVVTGTDRYSPESVRRIARLRVGDVVNGPDVQEAIQRLFATGEFSDVRVSVTPEIPAIFFIEITERPIVGQYRFEERNFDVVIVAEDGKLSVQAGSQGAMGLLYQGEHKFRLSANTGARLEFEVVDGEAVAVTLRQGETIMRAKRQ